MGFEATLSDSPPLLSETFLNALTPALRCPKVLAFTTFAFLLFPFRTILEAAEMHPLDLVPESVALYIEIPNAASNVKRIVESKLAERAKSFPPLQQFVQGSGIQQWNKIEKAVEGVSGKPLTDLILGACSESVVIAVSIPDDSNPKGVVIARAREAAAIEQAIETWRRLSPKQIEETRRHLNRDYIRRAKSSNSEDAIFFAIINRLLVLSDQEEPILTAIKLHESAQNKLTSPTESKPLRRSINEADIHRSSRQKLPVDAIAYLHIPARRWDRVLNEGARKDPESVPFVEAWKHVDSLNAALRFDEGFTLDAFLQLDQDHLPAIWKEVATLNHSTSKLSGITKNEQHVALNDSETKTSWSSVLPQNAVLAICGRSNFKPLLTWWTNSAKEAKQDEFIRNRRILKSLLLGRDFFDEVFPTVLNQVTMVATSTEAPDPQTAPFDVTGHFKWSHLINSDSSSPNSNQLHRSIDNGLLFGMNYVSAYLAHQSPESRVQVNSEESTSDTLRWLDGFAQWQPAYRIDSTSLTITSSKSRLNESSLRLRIRGEDAHKVNDADSTTGSSRRLAAFESRFFPDVTQLIWLDSNQARKVLTTHREWIVSNVSQRSREPRELIASRLNRVVEVLGLFDGAFIASKIELDSLTVKFGFALDSTMPISNP